MRDTLVRWTLLLVGVLALGPLLRTILGPATATDGVTPVSAILAETPVGSMLRAVLALALALGLGAICAKLKTIRHAMFVTGATLAWPALASGQIAEAIRTETPKSGLVLLSIETLVLGVLAVGGIVLFSRLAPAGRREFMNTPPASHAHNAADEPQVTPAFIAKAIGIAVAAAAGGAWLIAVTNLPGQTLAAAVFAGFAAGFVTAMFNQQAPAWVMVASVVLVGVASPIIAFAMAPASAEQLIVQFNSGQGLFPPARVLPFSWIAGAMMGLPVGSMWGAGLATADKA